MAAPVFVAAISLVHGACASALRSPFPTATALAQLAAQPIASTTAPEPVAEVDEWKLTGPLPDAVELQLRAPVSAWDRLLADAAAVHAGQVLVTESAQCAAREIGLFRAAQPTGGAAAGVASGAPSDGLLRFIAARCGLAAPIVQTSCRATPSSPPLSDDQMFAADSLSVRAALGQALDGRGGGPLLAGLWVGRSENQALICWTVAPHLIHAKRIPMSPDASGRIVIQGELVGPANRYDALVTAGRLGVRACATRGDVAVPHVVAACAIDPADTAAWIEITAYQPGQINGRRVLSLLAWRAGALGDTYRRAGANETAAPVTCAPAAATADGLGACINQIRSAARLSPLSVSGEESQTAGRLTQHLFASLAGLEPPSTAEQVTLGLRAGWDVGSPLMFGQMAQAAQDGAPDAGQLVTTMLERPGDRAVLLDPAASTMAVAVSPAGAGPGGGVVATYRPAIRGVFDQWPEITRVVGRLNRMRAARGLGPVTDFSPGVGSTMEEARFLTEGHRRPRLAISNAAEDSARNMRVAHVHGWIAEGDSLDNVLIPRPLIELPAVELALGVAHHRRRGEPWTEFVVLFVMPHLQGGRLDPESDVVFAPLRTNLSRVP
jgi:hypothetical protein